MNGKWSLESTGWFTNGLMRWEEMVAALLRFGAFAELDWLARLIVLSRGRNPSTVEFS
jgi:hypothetical protein